MPAHSPLTEPATAADLGVDRGILLDLALKTLFYRGRMTRTEISTSLHVSGSAMQEIMEALSQDGLTSILGSDGAGPAHFVHALTQKGLDRADSAFARSGYVGPAPVSLNHYLAQVNTQITSGSAIGRDAIDAALSALVIPADVADRIGRAVASRRPTLLFGESGNGKTAIARAVAGAMGGTIFIPYAVEIMGHIVRIYDPSKHLPAPCNDAGESGILKSRSDGRWIRIHRPVIWAGGELTRHSLELVRDESGVYEAPLQLKANGGTLIIDDFGRQQMPASQLLNRWIGALEGGADHLTMHTGQTVELPFDVLVLFSTNLHPSDLGDDAFLRRIRYKIEIPSPSAADYTRILQRECLSHQVQFDAAALAHLVRRTSEQGRELRGCQPRDIVEAVVDAARYEGRSPELTPEAIDEACDTYFVALHAA